MVFMKKINTFRCRYWLSLHESLYHEYYFFIKVFIVTRLFFHDEMVLSFFFMNTNAKLHVKKLTVDCQND